jgi:hypothetical protein
MGNGIYFKIAGWVDLDMLHIFAIKLNIFLNIRRKVLKILVKLQVLGNNSKTVNNIKNLTWSKTYQHCKIYLPCNFEVNLIIHLGVIALFSSNL